MKRRTHIQLTPYEDLFSTEEQRQDYHREKVMDIPLNELHPFKELSLRAKGLMIILMDLPPNWRFSVAGLSKIMPDGPDAIRSTMWKLESMGYLERIRKTGANGRSYVEYNIYEMPKETMLLPSKKE